MNTSAVKEFIKKNKEYIFILVTAFVFRLIWVGSFFNEQLFNKWMPEGFDSRALALIAGKTHHFPTAWASYHVIVSFFYKLFNSFGQIENRLVLMSLISILLSAISLVFVYKIALKLFPNRKAVAVLSTLIYFFYYPTIYFNGILISENFFIPVFIWIFLRVISLDTQFKHKGILTGILIGITIVLRPNIITFLPFLGIWLFIKNKDDFKRLIREYAVDLIFTCGVVIVLVSSINYFFDKHKNFAFTGNGGVNVALNWCQPRRIQYILEDNESFWFSPPIFQGKDPSTDINTNVHFTDQGYYYRLGLECLKDNPSLIISNLSNIKNMFDSEMYPDFNPSPYHDQLVNIWKVVTIIFFILFLCFPLLYKNKKDRFVWLLAFLLFVSQIIIVYLTNPGEERYLVPMVFTFYIWGTATLVKIIELLLNRFDKKNKLKESFDDYIKKIIRFFNFKNKTNEQLITAWFILFIPVFVIVIIFAFKFNDIKRSFKLFERQYSTDTATNALYYNQDLPELSREEKRELINIAMDTVKKSFSEESKDNNKTIWPSKYDNVNNRLFVSFRVDGHKKGSWSAATDNLALSTHEATLKTLEDNRYNGAITSDDLDSLEIEIFVLGNEKRFDQDYEPGIHGLRLSKGDKQAFFYNSVVIENNWTEGKE